MTRRRIRNPYQDSKFEGKTYEELDDEASRLRQLVYYVLYIGFPKIPETFVLSFKLLPISMGNFGLEDYIRSVEDALSFLLGNQIKFKDYQMEFKMVIQYLQELKEMYEYVRRQIDLANQEELRMEYG